MIRIFTTNKNGKIELTAKELKELLDDSYWEGYRANHTSWTYSSPSWSPYVYCSSGDSTSIKLATDQNTTTTTAKNITINANANEILTGTTAGG